MNQAAFHPAHENEIQGAVQNEGFYRQKGTRKKRQFLRVDCFRQGHLLLRGEGVPSCRYLIPADWLKVTFMGDTASAVSLDSKYLSAGDSILGPVVFCLFVCLF